MTPWRENRRTDPDEPVQLLRVGAYAVCLAEDRILGCRLGPGEVSPGAWTLPGGGVDFGEHPESAVLRELEEETGLLGRVTGLLAVRSRVHPGRLPDGRERELHAIAILYRVEVIGGTLRDEPMGSTDCAAWLDRGDLAAERLTGLLRDAAKEALGPGA